MDKLEKSRCKKTWDQEKIKSSDKSKKTAKTKGLSVNDQVSVSSIQNFTFTAHNQAQVQKRLQELNQLATTGTNHVRWHTGMCYQGQARKGSRGHKHESNQS